MILCKLELLLDCKLELLLDIVQIRFSLRHAILKNGRDPYRALFFFW